MVPKAGPEATGSDPLDAALIFWQVKEYLQEVRRSKSDRDPMGLLFLHRDSREVVRYRALDSHREPRACFFQAHRRRTYIIRRTLLEMLLHTLLEEAKYFL